MKDTKASVELDPAADRDPVPVRALGADDLDAMVRIDRRLTGRVRRDYLALKLKESVEDSRIMVSLGAEIDGHLVGFLTGRVYYGEFGVPEPVALIDTIGVDPERTGQGVGQALLAQFRRNLEALGVRAVRTQADWNDWPLLRFLDHNGFSPLPRVTLEARLGS